MCHNSVFYWEYENEKKTGQKNLTFPNEYLNLGFLNEFLSKIWILRESRSIELMILKKSQLYLIGRTMTSWTSRTISWVKAKTCATLVTKWILDTAIFASTIIWPFGPFWFSSWGLRKIGLCYTFSFMAHLQIKAN